MNCKQCGSRHLKTLPYVYELGTYQIDNGSLASDEDTPRYETCHTRLAQTARPPRLTSQIGAIVGIIVGIVTTLFVFLFGAAALVIGLLILVPSLYFAWRKFRYNTRTYPQQYARWQQSFICIDCGNLAGTLD